MLYWYGVGKAVQLWQWDILTGQGDIYLYEVLYSLYNISPPALASYTLMHSLHPWILTSALLGAILLVSGRSSLPDATVPVLTYAVLISVSAVYVLTQAEPRYSIPLRPELYLAAVFFIWQVTDYLARLRAKSLARHKARRLST